MPFQSERRPGERRRGKKDAAGVTVGEVAAGPRPREGWATTWLLPVVRDAPSRTVLVGLGTAGLCLVALNLGKSASWPPHAVSTDAGYVAGVLTFVAAWTLMTGAMMLPSTLPFLRMLTRLGGSVAALAGGLGFWAVWTASGFALAGLMLASAGPLGALPPGGVERLAGGILMVAAIYQALPLANACRRGCATPFATLARRWRGQQGQALKAGLAHGASCLGCCVPMILVMLLVGMADVRWMFVLAGLTVIQKHPVWGVHLALPSAGLLAALALAIASGAWSPELAPLRSLCGA